MGATTLVVLGAILFYLYIVSKQRRKTGEPPLPFIGDFFQPILDYEEGLAPTTKSSSTNTDDIPVPVATIANDVAEVATTESKKEPPPEPPKETSPPPPPPPPPPTPVEPVKTPEPIKEEPLPETTTEDTNNEDSDKKKKKKNKKSKAKKKKKSKSKSKDSRDEHKRWSKHRHTNKKVAAATVVNPHTPPL